MSSSEPPPYWVDIRLDGNALLCVVAAALFATVAAGVIPALQAAKSDTHEVLKDAALHWRREMRAMLEEAYGVAERTGALERFYETDLVPLADQSVQAALLAYRSNRAMVDEVVTARRTALETKLKHLRLSADRAQAQFELDYLVGEQP